MIQIEKKIEMPQARSNGVTDALRRMKVGESFVLPEKVDRQNAYVGAKRIGIKIAARKMPSGEMRIWRIA